MQWAEKKRGRSVRRRRHSISSFGSEKKTQWENEERGLSLGGEDNKLRQKKERKRAKPIDMTTEESGKKRVGRREIGLAGSCSHAAI